VAILSSDLETYLESLLPSRHPILREMEAEAARRQFPIVGPLVGSFLALLARAIQARRVLELGAGFGYSAFWLAEALPEGGHLLAFEADRENVRLGRRYLERAGLAEKVTFRQGDALKLIEAEEGPFDLIFNDVDKDAYPQVLTLALPKLRKGGLLVTDNALWSGRVLERPADSWTAGIQAYNRMAFSHPGLLTTIVPLRDGVAVSLKIGP
jgi:predicted O-methyltransferase YrrM